MAQRQVAAAAVFACVVIGFCQLRSYHQRKRAKQPKVKRTPQQQPSRTRRKKGNKGSKKNQGRSVKPQAGEHFVFYPIGHIKSCFPNCRGTPRQGALAPLTRAKLVLTPEVQQCALEGLKEWSHVWITFVFHKNRASGKVSSTGRRSIKYKIEPPKHTKKVGIFATRTPHRVNPIGQTIAQVVGIEGKSLLLRGVDLVDGTPVLDIKPYVKAYESITTAQMVGIAWLSL